MNIKLLAMELKDLDQVLAIEQASHAFPWTRGHFQDALSAGYWSYVLWELDEAHHPQKMLGYLVLMTVLDELHLLNITIDPSYRRRGLAQKSLQMMDDVARQENISTVFLEVRESNLPARALYEQIGFEALAVRKDYYPAKDGREHAVVMKKNLALGN